MTTVETRGISMIQLKWAILTDADCNKALVEQCHEIYKYCI